MMNTAPMTLARMQATRLSLLTALALSLSACGSTPSDNAADRPLSPVASQTETTTGREGESALASFRVERLLTRRHELVLRTLGSATCPWRITDTRATDAGPLCVRVG